MRWLVAAAAAVVVVLSSLARADAGSPAAPEQGALPMSSSFEVPEPASLVLLGLGLVGLASVRRRQLRRQQP